MSKFMLCLFCLLTVLSCKKASVSINSRIPIATNGIVFHDDQLWVADLIGQSITAIDPQTGKINQQFDFRPLNTSPDDMVVLDDGSIIWTAPVEGRAGKITPGGEILVLTEEDASINPITQNPSTGDIYIGHQNFHGELQQIDVNSGITTTITSGLPSLNAFAFMDDNTLYAPLFNMNNLLDGYGGILKINVATGQYENFPVSFPEEAQKTKFKNTSAIKKAEDGSIYVLESTTPAVYKVDIQTNQAYRVGTLPSVAADNLAVDDQGNIYVTTFIQNVIYVFDRNGNRRKITIQN